MKEQARISRRRNKKRIGETVRVLFEGDSTESDLLWQGRMETQAPDIDGCVLINDAPDDFVPVPGSSLRCKLRQRRSTTWSEELCSKHQALFRMISRRFLG